MNSIQHSRLDPMVQRVMGSPTTISHSLALVTAVLNNCVCVCVCVCAQPHDTYIRHSHNTHSCKHMYNTFGLVRKPASSSEVGSLEHVLTVDRRRALNSLPWTSSTLKAITCRHTNHIHNPAYRTRMRML